MVKLMVGSSPMEWFDCYSGVDVECKKTTQDVGIVTIGGDCEYIEDLDLTELCEMIGNITYAETKDFDFATRLVQYLSIRFGINEQLRLEEDDVCEVYNELLETIII